MIMLELMLVGVLFAYLVLSVWVVVLAGKWAKKRGRRRWPWSMAAGISMYLLVAWEQIPTFLVAQYYCATQAGLKVYKTPGQWLVENPGVERRLTWQSLSPSRSISAGEIDTFLNQRVMSSLRRELINILPIKISTQEIIDRENKEVLVRYVSVNSGYGSQGGAKWSMPRAFVGGISCKVGYPDFLDIMMEYKQIGMELRK